MRITSLLEGLSLLYLLYCSIYLKRMKGIEEAIEAPGMAHGVLFILFSALLFNCWMSKNWSLKFTSAAFLSSLIPCGFLWLDTQLKIRT